MIRKATFDDIDSVEKTYDEHFLYEMEHGAFTVFKKGVYPTRKDAEKAVIAGSLYVYEKNNIIVGSMIMDKVQPAEYKEIVWGCVPTSEEVMVIHLLMVRSIMKGKGIATSLIEHAIELARNTSCKVLRLDTGSQNIPAVSLYKKLGFQIIAAASMKVGNTIEHSDHLFFEKVL